MKIFPVAQGAVALAITSFLLAPAPARAAEALTGVTAVASRASSDYIRVKLADGSYQPEFYSLGKGGKWGGNISDATVDKLQFLDVAHVVAGPLADQNFVPATDPAKTKLLIMVYWGTTQVPGPSSDSMAYDQLSAAQANLASFNGPSVAPSGNTPKGGNTGVTSDAAESALSGAMAMLSVENEQRDRLDFKNAQMLGYDSEGVIGTDYGNNLKGTAFAAKRDTLVAEIEENRYFVVLMAYDFQLLWKQKKHKLLWETRFSISERHNEFDKALPAMAQYASRYFGQDTHGLLRAQVLEGHVDVGEVKSLGEVAPPQK
jgi:hypothetical protein